MRTGAGLVIIDGDVLPCSAARRSSEAWSSSPPSWFPARQRISERTCRPLR